MWARESSHGGSASSAELDKNDRNIPRYLGIGAAKGAEPMTLLKEKIVIHARKRYSSNIIFGHFSMLLLLFKYKDNEVPKYIF